MAEIVVDALKVIAVDHRHALRPAERRIGEPLGQTAPVVDTRQRIDQAGPDRAVHVTDRDVPFTPHGDCRITDPCCRYDDFEQQGHQHGLRIKRHGLPQHQFEIQRHDPGGQRRSPCDGLEPRGPAAGADGAQQPHYDHS